MTHAKILKLSSGEEIICNVENNPEASYLSVISPMKVQSYPKATRNGIEEALTLQRWIHFSETNTYKVPMSQVIVMTEASIGLSKFYDYCVKKMNIEEEDVVQPTNKQLRDIEREEIEEEYEEWDDEPLPTYH